MSSLQIGWATCDISTTRPINLTGQFYMRISKGVLDPILANVLFIDSGDDLCCWVTLDLAGIFPIVVDTIRAKTAARLPGFPVEKIIISATHTHSAPGTTLKEGEESLKQEITDYMTAEEYREYMTDRVADAIVEARANRAPGGVSWGYGFGVASHSRRSTYADDLSQRPGAVKNSTHGLSGHAAMYGKTNDDQFIGYEAGADHVVNLLFTFNHDGALTGAIVNVPCPSQNSESIDRISADYWHDLRVEIRRRHGDIHILPQCAAAGDLSPRILHYQQAQQRRFRLKYGREEQYREEFARKDIAERIAAAFDEVLPWASRDIKTDLPLAHLVDTVHLSRRRITPEERADDEQMLAELEQQPFAAEGTLLERINHDSRLQSGRRRCRQIINRFDDQKIHPTLPMELHVVRLGDIAFATNRFELYMDYMHRMQARSPFEQTFVVQLTGSPTAAAEGFLGSAGSYLATERGEWGRGYSASRYCNQVSSRGGQELVENTLVRLHQLKAADAAPTESAAPAQPRTAPAATPPKS
jgi:hypothetical protein